MSKIILLFFILSLTLTIHGYSQKCKVGEDPITGEHVVSFDYGYRTVYYEYQKTTILMEIKFEYNGALKVSIPQGTEVIFKLENGEVIKLKTRTEAAPKPMTSANQYTVYVYTSYSFPFELIKEDITRLASSKVVLIRYPDTQGGTLDIVPKGFSKKIADALLKGAKYIQENLK